MIDSKGIDFYTPRRGEKIILGELTFKVLHPDEDVEDYSSNNTSIVLKLDYGNISFLFTGDIEEKIEQELVDQDKNIEAEILKIAHHGSKSSTSDLFLEKANSEVAIITVGEDNRYNHPHEETLEILKNEDIDIYRTDLNGDIVVRTDGSNYQVEVSKEGEPRAPPEEVEDSSKININTAGKTELQKLHGIGPATAENII